MTEKFDKPGREKRVYGDRLEKRIEPFTQNAEEMRDAIDKLGAALSPPHKRFCDIYLTNGNNGTQAYKTSINLRGSDASCGVGANRLLKRNDVRSYVDMCRNYRTDEVLNHLSVNKERVLTEEANLAFIDIRKIFDSSGEFLHPTLWPEEIARAAAGVDIDQRWDVKANKWRYTYKIKLNDKGRALGRLETVLGMNKAAGLTDESADLFKSFIESIDGNSRKLPSEMEED